MERDIKFREERIRKVLEDKEFGDRYIEEELFVELRNLFGKKRVIKFIDVIKVMK